jgi:hypothetical protein
MADFVCLICGSPITSEASISRGYGSECARALFQAKRNRVMNDTEMKAKFYAMKTNLLIALMTKKNFRNGFKKSFQETILKQKTWLSKKQADICQSILFDFDADAKASFEVELAGLHQDFWDSIDVTREDIECARQIIRDKR